MRASDYIDDLAASGRYHFTSADALAALGASPSAMRAQLRRLAQRGRIAEPFQGFHVIVPPEYRRLGCLPAEQFIDQLMQLWGEPYYLGLLTAAERHGAAHQRPQVCQVIVRRNRRPLTCGQVRVAFIARGDLEAMPVTLVNTPRGQLRYATPEVTALELVGYPDHCGGLDNVATVLAELAEAIDPGRLLDAARLCPVGWSQRLGYLLELGGHAELAAALAPFVRAHARSVAPLHRASPTAGCSRSAAWKLIVNVAVEVDT